MFFGGTLPQHLYSDIIVLRILARIKIDTSLSEEEIVLSLLSIHVCQFGPAIIK